jgi:acyl carrier protein
MKEITIKNVRAALLAQEVISESELSKISDEDLKLLSFKNDLGMDSLDCIIFIQNLEGGNDLSLIDLQILDAETIGHLLNRSSVNGEQF